MAAIDDDLFRPEVITDPYSYFGRVQAEDPIHWNALYDLWLVTRHDDLLWLVENHEAFSSEVLKRDPRPPYPPIDEADLELYDYVRGYMIDQFAERDPPELFEMRKLPMSYFTNRAVERLRPAIRSFVASLLDEVMSRGHMDIRADLATPLPVMIITEMMGIPPEDGPAVRAHASKLLSSSQGEANRLRTQTAGMKGMLAYLEPLVEARLGSPGDDLISVMASGEVAGTFDRHQVLVNCATLLVAGHETTINLICNGTLAFLGHPEQWRLLCEDPQRWAKPATEECLRFDPPVKSFSRIATRDIERRGRRFRENDRIRCIISAANRDPEVFDEPDSFDITRDRTRHVAFGAGVHHCIGAMLARLEFQETMVALAQRLPQLRLVAEERTYRPTLSHRSLERLRVQWS